jgi:flagellar basal body-associated protein FliL
LHLYSASTGSSKKIWIIILVALGFLAVCGGVGGGVAAALTRSQSSSAAEGSKVNNNYDPFINFTQVHRVVQLDHLIQM